MFRTDENKIYLTRGNTAQFRPVIEDYTATEEDKVVFAVKKTVLDSAPIIRKEVAAGENIALAADDTSSLTTGSYLYDITLITAEGDKSTFASGVLILEGDLDNERN